VGEQNCTIVPVQSQTTGGLPGPVANTTHDMSTEACVYELVVENNINMLSLGKDKGKSSEQ